MKVKYILQLHENVVKLSTIVANVKQSVTFSKCVQYDIVYKSTYMLFHVIL